MVIDTSALIALLTSEEQVASLSEAVSRDHRRYMSVASVLEASIVLESRYGEEGSRELDLLVSKLQIEVSAIDLDQLEWARHAYRTFGKGRHKAGLNFGDCFSYALAKVLGEPILFVGEDFSETDISDALGAA